MTVRLHFSSRGRQSIFERLNGRCHICRGEIIQGQAWDIEHEIPLAMGGADDETNWRLAHRKCHRSKTSRDLIELARAKRRQNAHLGIKAISSNPLPCGRFDPRKKKLNGQVVDRETGEPWGMR